MSFNQNDVEKLAHLARLAVDKASAVSIAEDLSNILELVSQIDEINVDNIEPMEHAQNASQPTRADIVTEANVRDIMQKLVPENATAAGLYLVPSVIE